MSTENHELDWDVAIIGGGPAGLSAAIVLGRACRRVVLFDHGYYRNYAARAVHGFLGLDGIEPEQLRHRGRRDAAAYGIQIRKCEVISADSIPAESGGLTRFEITTEEETIHARALLLATGVRDELPEVPGLHELYGESVHHCPYCDGWEYRGKRLIAFGEGESAAKLALSLRGWSSNVAACTNGNSLGEKDRRRLGENDVDYHEQALRELRSQGDRSEIVFEDGSILLFDALFFSADQTLAGKLPKFMRCDTDDDGLVVTNDKQCAKENGLFVAGDLHSDVQMAVVAAAEGAIAATAINKMLLAQDAAMRSRTSSEKT
jgi:thioredoxin reductase